MIKVSVMHRNIRWTRAGIRPAGLVQPALGVQARSTGHEARDRALRAVLSCAAQAHAVPGASFALGVLRDQRVVCPRLVVVA